MGTTTQKREAPYRGPTSSQDWNNFQDEVVSDLGALDKRLSDLKSTEEERAKILFSEMEDLRARIDGIQAENDARDLRLAIDGGVITKEQNFRSVKQISYGSLSTERRMRVDPRYGQVLLPYNRLSHLFFSPNINADGTIDGTTIQPNLDITVTPISEDGGPSIVQGTTRRAFDGHNQNYWVRTAEYPIDSDVTEVHVRLTVAVPQSIVDTANLLTIHPYPLGQVDIVGVWSSDGADPPDAIDSNLLPGFVEVKAASHYRLHFPDQQITHLVIDLKQRRFIEREGLKVFQYGAQEISLQLVEFDQTTEATPHAASVGTLNGVVSRFDAPDGHVWDEIRGFFATPDFPVSGGPTQPPVYHRIFTDEDLTDEVWNSFTDTLPQDTPVSLVAPKPSSLWVLSTARFDASTGKSPVLASVILQADTVPE